MQILDGEDLRSALRRLHRPNLRGLHRRCQSDDLSKGVLIVAHHPEVAAGVNRHSVRVNQRGRCCRSPIPEGGVRPARDHGLRAGADVVRADHRVPPVGGIHRRPNNEQRVQGLLDLGRRRTRTGAPGIKRQVGRRGEGGSDR